MLAGVGALVLAHHGETLFGDGAHLLRFAFVLEVQNRAHVQGADGCVGVPGAVGAVSGEYLIEAAGVFGEILQAHGAVLDEGHGFSFALHGHQDVEPGLAHFPHGFLKARLGRLDDAFGEAEIRHQLAQAREAGEALFAVLTGELHQQQGRGVASDETLDGRAEHVDVPGELDQGAIRELHSARLEGYDVPGGFHRLVEGGEVADPQYAVGRDRLQIEFDLGEQAQRALGSHQQVGHVVAFCVDAVDVVTTHAAQKFREAAMDLVALSGP